jgi:hypothetical protein
MIKNNFLPNPEKEKKQLAILAAGLLVIATALLCMHGGGAFPFILMALGALAGSGWIFFDKIGRDIYLGFVVLASGIGFLLSQIMLFLLYNFGIVLIGSVLKLMRVDQLDKNWAKCKAAPSMFKQPPATTRETFERLS